ncbi:helix-turn-helix domain-containing protein [Dyella sp.]|jgi:cytoskeleton protein RodZ|uniref:helix-turn-helix domain-containing protein n=1 Tax=Dyella sp. TaxID=1869338 RepID=UPI002D76E4EB|nr:helix-turn-helix domain-containing protein [Dyella sp.]HET6432858.1 helix-turn-helix domain-containing protein [Dyella sp.]
MTSQQPFSPGADSSSAKQLADAADDHGDAMAMSVSEEPGFGSRLRAARERRGLDIEACAQALKLPARVLRQLESSQHDGIDYQVYLGSYITKYGRYLDLDDALVQAEVARIRRREEPVLVATGGISHSRYLLERYATAATYVVLTAVIIVPMIWLGVRGTLNRDISRLAPLDAAPVAQQELPTAAGSLPQQPPAAGKAAPSASNDEPLLASMVPDINMESLKPAPVAPATVAAVVPGAHSISLSLSDASWVEITAADGTRIEYGLLPAGTRKTYQSDKPLEVRLGNATGAQVELDGKPLPLDGYRRANVAHFRVELQDGRAIPHGA